VYRRGLALYEVGNYTGAIATWEALRESIGERRGWKVLYNLALGYQAMGDTSRAIERYDAFLSAAEAFDARESPEVGARLRDALGRVHALKATYGAVVVRAPASGAQALTRVGSGEARPAGYTVWLSPGEHEVEVGTGTSRAHTVKVIVKAGTTVEVATDDLAPPPAPVVPAPAAPPLPGPSPAVPAAAHFPTAWVIVGAGLTVASAALPIALGLHASSQRQAAEEMGAGSTGYTAAVSDFHSTRTLYYASYVAPGLVAAVTATIATVGLLGGRGRGQVELRAAALGRGGAAWLAGSF
jgi:tetratricopeptide (TPR) repeat protein